MNGDRELLELAALAGGYLQTLERIYSVSPAGTHVDYVKRRYWESGREYREYWNPLYNDGDALRLAVKLGLPILRTHTAYGDYWSASIGYPISDTRLQYVHEALGADPNAATRRAIVRAAAEIGRGMP